MKLADVLSVETGLIDWHAMMDFDELQRLSPVTFSPVIENRMRKRASSTPFDMYFVIEYTQSYG